jgi:hypothetical protein
MERAVYRAEHQQSPRDELHFDFKRL